MTEPLAPFRDLPDPIQQATYVDDAFTSGDPFLVVLALKEVGTLRRIPVALDENPPLSEVLRVMGDLRLAARIEPA
jgi:hypothetical protein